MLNIKPRLIQIAGPLGGYRLSQWLTRATPKIMMYHRFSEEPKSGYVHRDEFEYQVRYMKRHFNVMRLDDLADVLIEGGGRVNNAIVITVDDGYRDFYDIAYPVLKKYAVPASLFVTTKFVDGRFWLWPDQIRFILKQSVVIDSLDMSGTDEYLHKHLSDRDRDRLWERIITHLLSIGDNEKGLWIKSFANTQGITLPECPSIDYQAITWSQAQQLSSDNIEIGAHTRTHPSLGRLMEDQLVSEIHGSIEDIRKQLGYPPKSFCYPNGQPADYTDSVKRHVKSAGCRCAVTAFYDRYVSDDLYELRRFTSSERRFQFAKSVNGVELLSAYWLNSTNKNHVHF